MSTGPTARPRVSVIATGAPGPELDACLGAVEGQSLPASAYEVIITGPGSAVALPGPAEEAAARNAGLARAQGAYVIFLRPGDELTPEALGRLHHTAVRTGADVVLGKVGGTSEEADPLFATNRDRCGLADAPLTRSLTPHHLFRAEFLRRHGVGFEPAAGSLADARFMITAYLRTTAVAVVGDLVCCLGPGRTDQTGTTGPFSAADADCLRSLVELVRTETAPGPVRDAVVRRLLCTQLLVRLQEPSLLREPPEEVERLAAVLADVVTHHLGDDTDVAAGLPALGRLRLWLATGGRTDALLLLARRQHGDVRATTRLSTHHVRRGVLELELVGTLQHRDGSPLVVRRRSGGFVLDPALTAGLDGVGPGGWAVGNPLEHARVQVAVQDPDRQTAWLPTVSLQPSLDHLDADRYQVVLRARTEIDPRRLGPGLDAGHYPISVVHQVLGYSVRTEPEDRRGPVGLTVDAQGLARGPAVALPLPLRKARGLARRLLPGPTYRGLVRVARSGRRRLRSLR